MLGRIKTVHPLGCTCRFCSRHDLSGGFGFIDSADGIDRFFHQTSIDVTINDTLVGLVVRFEPALHATKGPRALQVTLIGSTPGSQTKSIRPACTCTCPSTTCLVHCDRQPPPSISFSYKSSSRG